MRDEESPERAAGDDRERPAHGAVGDWAAPESVVVTRSVRLVVPFVFTYGLYTVFHGAKSVGGGFQGGVVVAAAVVTVAFAFGVDQTGRWLDSTLLAACAVGGVAAVVLVGVGPALFGGTFLAVDAYPGPDGALYAIEVLEVGIGATVAATIVVLFFEIAGGFESDGGPR